MMRLVAVIITVLCLNDIKVNVASELSNVSISDVCEPRGKLCMWKCCPPEQYVYRKSCMPLKRNLHFDNITVYDSKFVSTNKTFVDVFQVAHGILSDRNFARNSFDVKAFFKLYLMDNGNLYLELPNMFDHWRMVTPDHFCVDINLKTNKTIVLAELDTGEKESCMSANMEYALLVSIVFLVLTVVPYCWFAQLRDLNAAILITFVIFYTVPFIIQSLHMYIRFTKHAAIATAVFYHFFSVSSYCWTNVMFYRIRASASDVLPTSQIKQFLKYCIYTIGLPLTLAAIVAVTEIYDLSHIPWFITPQIVSMSNILFEGKESLFYLYSPLVLLLMFNWVVCLVSLVKLCQKPTRIPMSVMVKDSKDSESPLISPARYVCLLALLSLQVAAHSLAAYCPTDASRALAHVVFSLTLCVGPALFTIFVINRNVFQIVKKSFAQRKDEPCSVLFKNEDIVTTR